MILFSLHFKIRYCKDAEATELERLMHCDGIWLHALRYEGKDWAFETAKPHWALGI